MKKRALSIALVLAMIMSLMPVLDLSAFAASSDTDSGALSALGIDTDKAPDGYDPYSTDNPYGKNTVELSPVYELYTVGLNSGVNYDASFAKTTTLQNGANKEAHSASAANSLKSTLYGDEKWSATTVEGIMGSGATSTVASGTTTATGNYTLISTGTVSDTAADNISANGYLTNASNASTELGGSFKFALSSVAAGNFDGNSDGLATQTAMVYTSDYSNNGGIYLRFGNAESGTYGSNAKELLSTTKKIGNPELTSDGKLVENFAENPYQLQNYLQVATGDWNGDGIDEVAVYVPEEDNSRIIFYALQLTSSDDVETAYLNPSKWSVVWTYYLHENNVVSNMVSFTSGDVNMDGTDDLAATWGYYYGPTQNIGSTAVVMFGSKGTAMLTVSQQFSLTYGSSNIVRASFAFGDMAGSDSDVLILCGQSDADLKAGNTQSRYVALYNWSGEAFTSTMYQNFDLFAKEEGDYLWKNMKGRNDKLYSLPLCASNSAVISQGASGGGDLLYFDSLIIEYTKNGLDIKEAWDQTSAMQQNTSSCVEYVEYGATAGDFTGQTGAGALVTMIQTLSSSAENSAAYAVTGSHTEPVYTEAFYYRNWLYKLFGIKTNYYYISGYETVADSTTVNSKYYQLTMGKAYMVAVDPSTSGEYGYYHTRTQTDFSTSICLANTDNDSSYMNYSGTHYYTYTDPSVLAVLAAPPYFSDLLNRDDLSANYSESTTSYSKTSGSGTGSNVSATIKLGAYVSYEQDFKVFGVTVASVEAEASVVAGFTFEAETASTLEQTVTYNATSGEDMVAFYSIPMEIYEYQTYVPDGDGGYKKVLTTVNIPHEAAVRLISLKEYEFIAKDYSVLPAIEDNVLTHTIGDPSTYPSSTDGYKVIAQYTGTPSAVGFSSTEGGSGISQEIAMSTESSNTFSASVAVEAKAGAGAGGVKVGIIAGAEAGAGLVKISTNGSSFSGDMQNMPIEAQPYGYGMNWRIFSYKYSNGGITFPVVSYILSDVQSPCPLPADFKQNITDTTENSITLDWSYDKAVAGFRIYRYYEFPDGSGSYELKYVPFIEADRFDSDTKTYYFQYEDKDLSPYTEYSYQIQTVSATNPKQSIYSEPMICRTKTLAGYPVISLNGLDDNGQLPIYPDADSTVEVSVASAASYSGLSYQWQKLVNGVWVDLSGKTDDEYTVSNAGSADKGSYRCRVNAIYYDNTAAQNYYISAYSTVVETAYAKRSPTGTLLAIEKITPAAGGETLDGLTANIELYSANKDHATAPSGNVTFVVEGTDYKYSETIGLEISSNTKLLGGQVVDGVYVGGGQKYYSTASLTIPSLPEGIYTVTAYYGGSKVFRDMQTSSGVLVIVGNASAYMLSLLDDKANSVTEFEYGKEIRPSLASISKALADGSIQSTKVTSVGYKLLDSDTSGQDDNDTFDPNDDNSFIIDNNNTSFTAPNIGSYTLEAYIYDGGTWVLAASQEFDVTKKPVTISVENKTNISQAAVVANPPVIKSTDLSAAELAALNLFYTTINSAGNTTTLNNDTLPGNYTITACTSSTTPVDLYNNYSVTYTSGTYTIIGATYRLTAVAADYTDLDGTRAVGTVGISNKTESYPDYTAGTPVVLYAKAESGYQVKEWTVLFEDPDIDTSEYTQDGGEQYVFTTQARPVTVTVTFEPAEIRLYTVSQPIPGGAVTCADENFSSGAFVSYGAEYSFTATPAAGYHFSKWQTVAGGNTAQYAGTSGENGTNSLTVTSGKASMTVYAVFTRDSYTLNLSGDIKAYYMYDDNGVPPMVERAITSGSSLPGDTQITVLPKTGYQAAEGAYFIENGTTTADTASHVFNITQNTTVSLSTVRNSYAVTTSAENGSVAAKIGSTPADSAALASVPGGSALTFTAHAARGYVFDHWKIGEASVPNSTETLTISELGSDTAITAVFAVNTAYTATATISAVTRGTMNYTLYDTYGVIVGTENTPMPSGGLKVYEGESIVLSVAVNSGSMMEQWKVNNVNTYTTQKTFSISNIGSNIAAVAYLKASTSYAVYFMAMDVGETGSTLAATADNLSFNSDTLQYGGSELAFLATPADGYMLDYWTLTSGANTVTESTTALTDASGNKFINPVYNIYPLKQNITVRAHFIALVTNNVVVPDTNVMGSSVITYVTPILPTDTGVRSSTAEEVRSGATVMMTFTPESGFGTSADYLKGVIEAAVNGDAVVTVVKSGEEYRATVTNLTKNLSIPDETSVFYNTYTVTVPAGVSASPTVAKEGDTVTLTVAPGNGYSLSGLTLDNGTLNETVSSSLRTYTFAMPAANVSVSVQFAYSGGGASTTSGGAASEDFEIPALGNGTDLKIPVSVSEGKATMDLSGNSLQSLLSSSGIISFNLSSLKDVTGVSIGSAAFGALIDAAQDSENEIDGVSISLPDAEVTFDPAALAAIGLSGSGDVTLTAQRIQANTLTADQQILVGDRPIIDLTLNVGSKTVSDFGTGSIEVKVPYTLGTDEDPDNVVVWYLNDDLVLESVTGSYDAASGSVIFTTDHFSKYVIGTLPFDDVDRDKWYFDSISFAYANGLFSGTDDTTFDPSANMTRGMLVTVLWRLEGEPAAGKSTFTDVKNDEWYAKAVSWAASNGIVTGYGNGIFSADDIITREQLAVIFMNYSEYKKYDIDASNNLSCFKDNTKVSTWAKDAMQWANAEGLINGIGNDLLSPKGSAERCQVAAILQRYIENIDA